MAKLKAASRKLPVQPLQQKSKVFINNRSRSSMTSWLFVLAMVLPLLYSTVTIDPAIAIRYIFLSVFILLFIAYFFALRKGSVMISFSTHIKYVFALAVSYCIWSFASLCLAVNSAVAIYEVSRQLLNVILLLLVMVAVKEEPEGVLKVCKALLLVTIIQSGSGILQHYNISFIDIPGTEKPYGFAVHRNLFGSGQALLIPFVLFVLYKGQKVWKYVSILALTGVVVSVIISTTRSAWIAAISASATALILIITFSPVNRKKWIIGTLTGTISIIVLISILVITNKNDSALKSLKEKGYFLIKPSLDNSASTGRLVLWSKSLKLIKDHPVFGVGPGNWKLAIWAYGSEGTSWGYGEQVPSRPHNIYLQAACESGIPGAIFYIGMWVLLVIIGLALIFKSAPEDMRVLTILMLAGLAAFATDGMFSFSTERIEHSLYVTLMGGIILGLYANLLPRESKNTQLLSRGLIFTALCIIAFNVFIGYNKYNFEKHANLARYYNAKHQYEEAINAVEEGKSRVVTIDPGGDPIEMNSAAAYIALGNYSMALEEMLTAGRYHPNSARVFTTMGVIYAKLQQYGHSIQCYNQAIQLTPHYNIALKNLAYVYFASGNYAACIKVLNSIKTDNDNGLRHLLHEAEKKIKLQ